MKKTLITLAALAMASVAQAADDTTWDGLKYNIVNPTKIEDNTNDFSNASGEYTMVLVLDKDIATGDSMPGWSETDSWVTLSIGGNGNAEGYWKHQIRLFKGDDGALVAGLWVDGARRTPLTDAVGTPHTGTAADANHSVILEENSGKYTLTLRLKNTDVDGVKFDVGTLESDDTLSYASWSSTSGTGDLPNWNPNQFDSFSITNAPEGLVEHMLVFQGYKSDAELATIVALTVPEPTTATLSLLALAGLAARRRRK